MFHIDDLTEQKTVKALLTKDWSENSGYSFKKIILNSTAHYIGSYNTYADIEGIYMAVYSYWEHNVEDFRVVENSKWVGIEIWTSLERMQLWEKNYGFGTLKLVVPKYIMELEVNNVRHACNIFKKYLRVVSKPKALA